MARMNYASVFDYKSNEVSTCHDDNLAKCYIRSKCNMIYDVLVPLNFNRRYISFDIKNISSS